MYLHLGKNIVVPTSGILGIFDLDNTTVSKYTRQYLSEAEKQKRVFAVGNELPKSFVVTIKDGKEMIYISQLSAVTLSKRSRIGI